MKPLQVEYFDALQPYETVYQRQKHLVEERIAEAIPNTLLIGEHPLTITTGRKTHAENLLNLSNMPIVEIERGGDVTLHQPGQLVIYPILKLPEGKRNLHAHLRKLEEVVILTLHDYGITGFRKADWTGVWVQKPGDSELQKLVSIGIAVRKWVTYHGIALNVTNDMSAFQRINPCGLPASTMTSLKLLNPALDWSMAGLQKRLIENFKTEFDWA